MNRFDNPFHDLWITEILNPEEFVKMFSPHVVSHAEELFGTGNVVVRGRQGSGKSMLLNLLNTNTRVAYARSDVKYPAPDNYKTFISANINLTRDNARIVVSRVSELPEEKRKDWVATTFSDYINYVLVNDLFRNVIYLAEEQKKDDALIDELRINWTSESRGKLLSSLVTSSAWYGYLDGCNSIDEIQKKVSERLSEYRRYFNFNVDRLDEHVSSTKTDIGEPVAVLADCLRQSGVIPTKANVYLKIDQHEELYELEKHSGYSTIFRQIINRALAMRDGRVSYRIGTRHYAWDQDISVWGSGASLENMRDYSIVDIDEMLKRNEHASTKLTFEMFAEDVFKRRLVAYGFQLKDKYTKGLLHEVFGATLSPEDRARLYVKKKKSLLTIPEDWAPEWGIQLEKIWQINPLNAKFGEIWLRQKAQQKKNIHKDSNAASTSPWVNKKYWMKERNEAALIQIAGNANEMLVWSGDRHLVDLAGWNILAFMTICKSVWAAWLRRTSNEELQRTHLPKIEMDEQCIGVNEASRTWAEKLKEGAAGGQRVKFITALGTYFSAKIRYDRALSNPGHNGISLLQSEFDKKCFITDLIRTCRDQGDLIESKHTTKSKDAKPRIKWYLNPLLCPFFRIPHVRTKEPVYITLDELEKVYENGGMLSSVKNNKENTKDEQFLQTELF